MRPDSKEVTDYCVADSHDESAQHDGILPAGLVGNTVASHGYKESHECNDKGQHESDWLEDMAGHQYGNEHSGSYRKEV